MTDRELLELAAKAAGLPLECHHSDLLGFEDIDGNLWNPLSNDGAALRLAVKLDMIIDVQPENGLIEVQYWIAEMGMDYVQISFVDSNKRYEATRRAIVCAAAEIGKSME